jgi:hypothetical protein
MLLDIRIYVQIEYSHYLVPTPPFPFPTVNGYQAFFTGHCWFNDVSPGWIYSKMSSIILTAFSCMFGEDVCTRYPRAWLMPSAAASSIP